MNPKIKNIIIFVSIALVLIVIYTLLIKKDEQAAIISSSGTLPSASSVSPATTNVSGVDPETASEILSLLLSVRSIKLDASVFDDIAFISLQDSTVPLTQDGTEGRPNPFAPIGIDGPTRNPTLPAASNTPPSPTTPIQIPPATSTTPATSTPAPAVPAVNPSSGTVTP